MNCRHRPKQFAWIVILRMYTDGVLTCARCGKRIIHKKQRYVCTFVGTMIAIGMVFVASIMWYCILLPDYSFKTDSLKTDDLKFRPVLEAFAQLCDACIEHRLPCI